jgi:hypothetical protein
MTQRAARAGMSVGPALPLWGMRGPTVLDLEWSGLVEGLELGGGEGQVGGLGGVGDGLGAAGAGDRDDDRGLGQHPGQGDLLGRDAVGVGYLLDGGVPAAELAGPGDAAERAPGQEGDAELGAVPELGIAGPERGRELVLHAGQVRLAEDLTSDVDLLDGGVGDAGQPDLALVKQVLQRPDGLGVRNLRVRPVELVEADDVDAERLQRRLGGVSDMGGRAVNLPGTVAGRTWPPLVATSTSAVSPEKPARALAISCSL